jgi:hypothetical protein
MELAARHSPPDKGVPQYRNPDEKYVLLGAFPVGLACFMPQLLMKCS